MLIKNNALEAVKHLIKMMECDEAIPTSVLLRTYHKQRGTDSLDNYYRDEKRLLQEQLDEALKTVADIELKIESLNKGK